MSATAVVDAWQDEEDASIRRMVKWMQANREAVGAIGIEDAFMGKGPHASLTVARSGGRCEGALMIAGYPVSRMVRLPASTWRSELGLVQLAQVMFGGKKSEHLEAAAREYAKQITGQVFKKTETHMAEALCMAKVLQGRFAFNLGSTVWRNR